MRAGHGKFIERFNSLDYWGEKAIRLAKENAKLKEEIVILRLEKET